MNRHLSSPIVVSWAILFLFLAVPLRVRAQSDDLVVRAILFYSPTCPHCATVIQEDLPPLFEIYGTKLEIMGIDVSQMDGTTLYQAAIDHFQIPENRLGVPTLIVGDVVLVGSLEIPDQFPVLIEYHLSQGGVDWPDIPGLSEALSTTAPAQPTDHSATPTLHPSTPLPPTTQPAPTATPGLILTDAHELTWQEKFARDPEGNILSVIVLAGMLGAFVWMALSFIRVNEIPVATEASWLIPILCLVGFIVAGYLAYVETAQVTAVCGPVGDCNTVQQSEYAKLFGVLPVGVLGLAGYVMILLAWLLARFGHNGTETLGALALLGMTIAGTLFSAYLTFLEPFVIGATCAWCLTSAIVMTALMLLSLGPGKTAYLEYTNIDSGKS